MKNHSFFLRLAGWRKAHRFQLQVVSLLLGVIAPFVLFAALSAGWVALATVIFGVLAAGLILTIWVS